MEDSRLERIEQRMDDLDKRSSAMERAMDRAMDRSRTAMAVVLPGETRRHMRAAWREQLLAVRSMIDFWADRLGDDLAGDDEDAKPERGRQNIPIE